LIGRQERCQEELFVACCLRDLIPEDHILRQVERVLDLSWLREEVRDSYDESNGRPSIDPEAAVRLMLAGLFGGITQDRKLMREAQVNIAIRWFAGYRLDEKLPDHSSLTRIRQRWGAERFRRIFERTVSACAAAGLVSAATVHVDATLIRADVSWESLAQRHVERVLEENDQTAGCKKKGKVKKYSPTDPDATMATSRRDHRLEPSYKAHTVVDDEAGVVLDVEVTTGEFSEGKELMEQLGRVEELTGGKPEVVTADSGYAHSSNYASLEEAEIDAVIPPQRERRKAKRIPVRRFKYDGRHKIVRCPGGKVLERKGRAGNGWTYRASSADCAGCALRRRCFGEKARSRTVVIVDGYEALLRARRRRGRWGDRERVLYGRHRWRVEGCHGEAKTRHGMRRAARRGLWNVSIQVYLTAAVMNLKRLAAAVAALLLTLVGKLHQVSADISPRGRIRSHCRPHYFPAALVA
jgi:transposase